MKTFSRAAALACAVCLATLAPLAFSAEKMDDKKTAPAAGQDGSWVGQLGNPSGGGDATLKAKDDKKTMVLWGGDADVKKQLADLLKKHSTVSVSGSLAADGTNLKVTSISEQEKKKGKGTK